MTIKYTKQEMLASEIGDLVGQVGTINKTIDEKVAEIRKARKNKPIGTLAKGDAIMVRFHEAQVKRGLKEQTIKNNCTTFRKAVNEGKTYDVNAHRNAKKGAQTAPKDKATTGVKFKGDAKLEDIVKGLRSMFNKFKESDKTTSLAMYLLDGLDDFVAENKAK